MTASIGHALAPGVATSALDLVRCADDAMCPAKRLGRNCAVHAWAVGGLLSTLATSSGLSEDSRTHLMPR